ncbi:uncharacterized protein HMPREF1541_00097 [Cyphellophora europaea CBS 101466]|uniref:alpha-1,2-Mannosidase n=1 Tax=Cyphellophora europaea (strain CBS 101466) TaxID=1220924 RepID=W2SB24_CYPE1|nr:uncharacterized protein HMPREF1541_00097 [Cyphellophora europaea CBS 101466]ETN45916.1 hypothetical protein HMPREF1541_00097 [Cyphellophora europaea CBS 101466]
MALTRRWTFALVVTSLLAFTYLLSNIYGNRSSRALGPSQQFYPPPSQEHDGKFSWKHRAVHFPLESYTPLPTGPLKILPRVQATFDAEDATLRTSRLERRQKVELAFRKCWNSYRAKAWMFDELAPLSGAGRNTFGGWSASLVDALDTLWIMGFKDEFDNAVDAVRRIDFSTSTDTTINVFETTIRYLGGFLSAYDLSGENALLEKAVEVGEMLLAAFDTPNRMPITRWEWKVARDRLQAQQAPDWMLVSELGSLSLEFTRLSQITGDDRWYDAIARITDLFHQQQNHTKIPGLWPVVVNPRDKDLTKDSGFTLGGMSDSLYEYFPKEYALLGGLSPVYQQLYETSMATVIKEMLFRPMIPNSEDILMSGDLRADSDGSSALDHRIQHLTCFAGGMLGVGGRLFSNDNHVAVGQKLTDGCIWAYKAMRWGIMPEIAHMTPCKSQLDCTWDEAVWLQEVGKQHTTDPPVTNLQEFAVTQNLPEGYAKFDDRKYILRPEAIESVFIYYRITGDEKYRDHAWEMFNAIEKVTSTEFANAAIPDIATKDQPRQDDRMESFWLAETLKYFYLIFSEPELISLDDYVLNTEAHPFKRPK